MYGLILGYPGLRGQRGTKGDHGERGEAGVPGIQTWLPKNSTLESVSDLLSLYTRPPL